MFDLRYHLASLAAVFLALAVGIILGVAISGKISGAEESLSAGQIADLERRLQNEQRDSESDRRRLAAAEELIETAYPALMENRLADRNVAVVFLGPVSGDVRSAIERTLTDAGAGDPSRLVAFGMPIDSEALDDFLLSRSSLATYAGDDFSELGRALGDELVDGGETPVLTQITSELVEERSGSTIPGADGVVVVGSWQPASDGDEEQEVEVAASTSLIDGILQGLQNGVAPVVGVKTSDASGADSVIEDYTSAGLSSVDAVDTPGGRLALALLLAGAEPGHYGLEDTASDGVLPPVETVPEEPSGG